MMHKAVENGAESFQRVMKFSHDKLATLEKKILHSLKAPTSVSKMKSYIMM